MAKKILFIGAGASHGARIKDNVPIGKDLLKWLKEQCYLFTNQDYSDLPFPDFLGASGFLNIREVKRLLDTAHAGEEYEEFITRIMTSKEYRYTDLIIIQKFLSFAFFVPKKLEIKNCFQEKFDRYYCLINHLKIDHTWKLISLNYDFLFEEAIRKISEG